MLRTFFALVCLSAITGAPAMAGDGQLPTAGTYRSAEMTDIGDLSVLLALFTDGNTFTIRIVDSPDDDTNMLVPQEIDGNRFRGAHPIFGIKDFRFEFRQPNRLLIHWPKIDITYHVACGVIQAERHCVLMDGTRRAWGFKDPRIWQGT